MFGLIGLLFIPLFLLLVFSVLSILCDLVYRGFTRNRRRHGFIRQDPDRHTRQTTDGNAASFQKGTRKPNGKKKIFADDEGEYVNFEEV